MADVFLGIQRGLGGFRKLVFLKKILPSYAGSKLFVSVFLTEASIAASIRHPNVVEIYDVRQDDRELFIAMEYICGLTLGEITEPWTASRSRSMSLVELRRILPRDFTRIVRLKPMGRPNRSFISTSLRAI